MIREIIAFDGRIVQIRPYTDGKTGVLVLEPTGEPWAKLSINIENSVVDDLEFVLSHDCNRLVDWISQTGLFEKTGDLVDYGMVTGQPVYRIKKEHIDEL